MNPLAILSTVSTIIDLVSRAGTAADDITRAYNTIKDVVSKPAADVTQADLDALEAEIDTLEERILAPIDPPQEG